MTQGLGVCGSDVGVFGVPALRIITLRGGGAEGTPNVGNSHLSRDVVPCYSDPYHWNFQQEGLNL